VVVRVPAGQLVGPLVVLGLLVVGLAGFSLADRAANAGAGVGDRVGFGHLELVLALLPGFTGGNLSQATLDA
jgi:hypothetical protein